MKRIRIECRKINISLDIQALDNATAKAISEALPIESVSRLWGDEIYFDIGVEAPAEGATLDVNVGDIAYWPQGECLCIFFGRTPASRDERPMPASKVVIVGRSKVEPEILRKVKSGSRVIVE